MVSSEVGVFSIMAIEHANTLLPWSRSHLAKKTLNAQCIAVKEGQMTEQRERYKDSILRVMEVALEEEEEESAFHQFLDAYHSFRNPNPSGAWCRIMDSRRPTRSGLPSITANNRRLVGRKILKAKNPDFENSVRVNPNNPLFALCYSSTSVCVWSTARICQWMNNGQIEDGDTDGHVRTIEGYVATMAFRAGARYSAVIQRIAEGQGRRYRRCREAVADASGVQRKA
ncbi:hypothetical protein EDD85DRAFT_794473 [Armillaria nabsnona]|nr:hypothetical protein EDD85DRAFT_794473 [Armillaria nabsnona]